MIIDLTWHNLFRYNVRRKNFKQRFVCYYTKYTPTNNCPSTICINQLNNFMKSFISKSSVDNLRALTVTVDGNLVSKYNIENLLEEKSECRIRSSSLFKETLCSNTILLMSSQIIIATTSLYLVLFTNSLLVT